MGACCILHMSLFHAVIVFKIVRLLVAGLRGVGVCCILHISNMFLFYSVTIVSFFLMSTCFMHISKKKVGTLVGTDALGNRYYENKSEQVGRDR